MNFEKIPSVEKSKQLLNLAFHTAREKSSQKNLTGNWLQIIRKKESIKLDVIKSIIVPRLDKILQGFPSTDHLPLFYLKLMKLTLDFSQLKKSLGAVNWAAKMIRALHRDYVRKINKCKDRSKITVLLREFYGRVSSTLKQIDPNLEYLEESRQIMRTYPDIKEMFTVCIYGFPNVGKTTLFNKLTTAKAKVASYSFTTTSINVGYLAVNGTKAQILDVPGTLSRIDKMNNIELQAELVIKELANMVIYIFDLSGHSKYSLNMQEQLLHKIKDQKTTLIYASKTDLPEGVPPADFKYKYCSLEQLKEEILTLSS